MKKRPKEREALEKAIIKYVSHHRKPIAPIVAQRITAYLMSRERQLQKLASDFCDSKLHNLYWKNGVNPVQENTERLVLEYIAKHIGCEAYCQRDPRGMMIRLNLKEECTDYFFNNFDGETSGVNWLD